MADHVEGARAGWGIKALFGTLGGYVFWLVVWGFVALVVIAASTLVLGFLLAWGPLSASYRVQAGLFLLTLGLLLLTYGRFLGRFLGYVVGRPIQSALLGLIFALVYCQLGNGLGLPNLFWSEEPLTRFLVSLSATLVLGLLGLNAYYLMPAGRTGKVYREIEGFLERDEGPALLGIGWLSRKLFGPPGVVTGSNGVERANLTARIDRWVLPVDRRLRLASDWAFIDSQAWLDPPHDPDSNQHRLSRFLRLIRVPFLTLLAMPALLPVFFENVPRAAPIVGNSESMTLLWEPLRRLLGSADMGTSPLAYAFGATCWLFGIWLGVQLNKSFIKASTWFTPNVGPVFERYFDWVASVLQWAWDRVAGAVRSLLRGRPREDGPAAEAPTPRAVPDEVKELRKTRRSLLTYGLFTLFVYVTLALSPIYAGLGGDGVIVGAALLIGGPAVLAAILFVKSRWMTPPLKGQMKKSAWLFFCIGLVELSIFGFFGFTHLVRLALALVRFNLAPYGGIAPAMAILALLGMVAVLSALFGLALRDPRWRLAGVLALVGVVSVNNWPIDQYRFEELDYRREPDASGRPRFRHSLEDWSRVARSEQEAAEAAGLWPVSDRFALDQWKAHCQGEAETCPKLVVVCVSGGAIRAAYWSATVLDRLGNEVSRPEDEIADPGPRPRPFDKHVRIIAGASGGMVGMPYYVTWLRDGLHGPAEDEEIPETRWDEGESWVNAIPPFSLRPLARDIGLREVPSMFFRRLFDIRGDRGIELERDWQALRFPFLALARDEEAGRLPSLIFSPMTVEDGRRLLISNLDLRFMVNQQLPPGDSSADLLSLNRGSALSDENDGAELSDYSLSATEFNRVFPRWAPGDEGGASNEILLSTAARMSASFPYVSPAVYLPTEPPLRVVDAGYYDNYGVDVVTAWLFRNRDWIVENTSGVLVVQVRDALSDSDRFGYPPTPEGRYARLLRGVQFFFSPIEAVAQARYTSASFRNDARIAGLSDYFTEETDRRDFFTTATFELSANLTFPGEPDADDWPGDRLNDMLRVADDSGLGAVAMNWYLTVAERKAVAQAIPDPDRITQAAGGNGSGHTPGEGTPADALREAFDLSDADLARLIDRESEVYRNAFPPDSPPEGDGLLKIGINNPDQRIFRIEQLRLLDEMVRNRGSLAPREGTARAPAPRNARVERKRAAVTGRTLHRATSFETIQRVKSWWSRGDCPDAEAGDPPDQRGADPSPPPDGSSTPM